jgi:hypothetical protein
VNEWITLTLCSVSRNLSNSSNIEQAERQSCQTCCVLLKCQCTALGSPASFPAPPAPVIPGASPSCLATTGNPGVHGSPITSGMTTPRHSRPRPGIQDCMDPRSRRG